MELLHFRNLEISIIEYVKNIFVGLRSRDKNAFDVFFKMCPKVFCLFAEREEKVPFGMKDNLIMPTALVLIKTAQKSMTTNV